MKMCNSNISLIDYISHTDKTVKKDKIKRSSKLVRQKIKGEYFK